MPTGDFPDPEGMVWTDAAGWVPATSPVWKREVGEAVARLSALPQPEPDPRDAEIERLRALVKRATDAWENGGEDDCCIACMDIAKAVAAEQKCGCD